jgi:hypothetical protein
MEKMGNSKEPDRCQNCGAELKSKYMIRVNRPGSETGEMYQSKTKKSVVGWIKTILDNMGAFEEITIINLKSECPIHKEYYADVAIVEKVPQ